MYLFKHLLKSNRICSKGLSCTVPKTVDLKSRLLILQRGYSNSNDDRSKPVVFSTSPAALNTNFVITDHITQQKKRDMPWYHPHVAIFSIAAFMIYFMMLREENDIDLMLSGETNDYAEKIMNMQKGAAATQQMTK